MIDESKFNSTLVYGIITRKTKKFSDCDLFRGDSWKYALLTKIKLWWGTPINDNKIQTLLGIQCSYTNIITGEKKSSNLHSGKLNSNDIMCKEINLKKGDYFSEFQIGFGTFISFIKFSTKFSKETIEFGKLIKEELKTVKLNSCNDTNMIQCSTGYYSEDRITALGCKYISNKDFVFINIIDILRIRHRFKRNQKEKERWKDNKNLNKYNLYIKTVAKTCLLPDALFFSVIKYCI